MADTALNLSAFTIVRCYLCSVAFCMHDDMYNQRRADHRAFWCPNGHDQQFSGESPERKRIAQLERDILRETAARESAERSRKWAESRAKGANIAAGKAKAAQRRLQQRVAAGVCPCCHRTFKQLASHINAKHPEYGNG